MPLPFARVNKFKKKSLALERLRKGNLLLFKQGLKLSFPFKVTVLLARSVVCLVFVSVQEGNIKKTDFFLKYLDVFYFFLNRSFAYPPPP